MEDKSIEISDDQKRLYQETAQALKGHERRVFMARVVKSLGRAGQRQAERELGWDRAVIGRGRHELDSGIRWVEAYSARGRKRAEEHLPNLLDDIRAIVDGQSQTDPTFESSRLYTRLSAAAVRQALISQKGYSDEELAGEETLRVKLNNLGYTLRSVKKSIPQKN